MGQGPKELRMKFAAALSDTEDNPGEVKYHDNVAWETAVDSIWVEHKDVFETVSRRTVLKACHSLVKELRDENRDVNVDDVNNLLQSLREPEVQAFTVFRTLMGVYSTSETPIQLGPFTVFHPARHRDSNRFPERFSTETIQDHDRNQVGQVEYVISVRKKTRDDTRAKELADESFRTFESVLRYMSAVKKGGYRWFSPGIFEQNRARNLTVVARSSSGKDLATEEVHGPRATVNLDEDRYTDSTNGNDWIWKTLATDAPNKLQLRIITAVEWIGHGMHELEDEKRFVQFMFALESLFNRNEKTFISQSVGSLITECVAFVIGSNLADRLKLKKIVNDFYSDRSAIVHGGSTKLAPEDVRTMFSIVTALVRMLTTDDRFKTMTTVDAFHDWVQEQKFTLAFDASEDESET